MYAASPYWDDPDETYGVSDVNGEEIKYGQIADTAHEHATYDDDISYLQEHQQAEEEWSCPQGLVLDNGMCQGEYVVLNAVPSYM